MLTLGWNARMRRAATIPSSVCVGYMRLSRNRVRAPPGRRSARSGRLGDDLAESFFATLETELIDRHSFHCRDEGRQPSSPTWRALQPRRRHSTLGQQSPDRL
jgi:hypothetical protein